MSKSGELKMIRYGRSIDAPINYHHRTGDSEGSGGSMLDFYAQVASAEDVYFGNEDEHAREMFLKGFRVYLKKVYTEQEREFLKRLLLGKESPFKIGQSLGVEHFAFLQGIQLKAFKKAKQLIKLARCTGWSGAETFTETIFKRLEQLREGYSLNEIIPQNAKIIKSRERARELYRRWYEKNREKVREKCRRWHEENREKAREKCRRWRKKNPELIKRYREENREKAREQRRRWRGENPEKKREYDKLWHEKNRERVKERHKRWYEKNRAKTLEKVKAYQAKQKALKEALNAAKIAANNSIVCLPDVQP